MQELAYVKYRKTICIFQLKILFLQNTNFKYQNYGNTEKNQIKSA